MRLGLVAAAVAAVFCCNTADAALLLQFGQGGNVGITEFVVNPGDSIDIEIYLTESGETTLTDNGLGFMDALFTLSGPAGAAHEQSGGEPTFQISPQFPDSPNVEFWNSDTNIVRFNGSNLSSAGAVVDTNGDSILLGTATLLTSSAGSWDLSVDPRTSFSFAKGANFYNVTGGIATLTAVPEPGSFAVLGLIAGTGAAVRFRRRRKAAKA